MTSSSSRYTQLKQELLETGRLFEDVDFPAAATSIYPGSTEPEYWLWKRPKDIFKADEPKFIVEGVTRFDLAQGELGDCWFVAAAAVLATKRDLFHQVVPPGQTFDEAEYAGIFRFNFWRFGYWEEVIIDDRLPVTVDDELKYGRNRTQTHECWGPLLEKAYAKLHGSYSALSSGHVRDALVDFTGGLSETFSLRREDELPPNIFDILHQSYQLGAVIGAGILGNAGEIREEAIINGLFRGHAYSITKVLEARISGWSVKLVRLRNPWGKSEWTGAWGDQSDEWKSLSEEGRLEVGLKIEDDGEFWMSMDDFLLNFHILEIVHLGPQTFARLGFPEESIEWKETSHHGTWLKGVNAGGSGLFSATKDLYYLNPQYLCRLQTPDADDVAGECTCIISLLQKDYRRRRTTPGLKRLIVGFDVHQVKTGIAESLHDSEDFYDKTKLKKQFGTRTPMREISCRLNLDPGLFCIVPNTLQAGQEGDFLLRIYTYHPVESPTFPDVTGPITDELYKPLPRPVGNLSAEMFWIYAGDDHVVDARDMRDLLNELTRKELSETTTFGIEACRCLICYHDSEQKGALDFDQMGDLWDNMLLWRLVFRKFDRDKIGSIDTYELREAFRMLGFTLSFDDLALIAVRYGGKDRTLFFEDFVLCISRTKMMYERFKDFSKSSPGEARLSLAEWMQQAMTH